MKSTREINKELNKKLPANKKTWDLENYSIQPILSPPSPSTVTINTQDFETVEIGQQIGPYTPSPTTSSKHYQAVEGTEKTNEGEDTCCRCRIL